MAIYYITLTLVCMICYYSEELDWPEVNVYNKLRIIHSSDTRKIYILVAVVLIFVAGFRYKVGMDYSAYYRGYADYLNSLPNAIKELDEPGLGVLIWIATRFYNNGAAGIFVASLVTISLPLIVIFQHSNRLILPTFLYITMGCWTGSFNGVRQYLAASVLFFGYESLKERNIVKYCIIVFIAFLFHRSAIVFIVLYFIVNRDISIPNIVMLIGVIGILFLSYDRVFQFANFIMDKEYSLEIAYTSRAVNRLRVLATFVPVFIFSYAYYDKKRTEPIVFSLNIIIFRAALSVLAMNSALLYRINIYTSLFAPLAITQLLEGISEKNKKIIELLLISMYFVMWSYELYKAGSMNHFQWIWER